MAALLGMSVSWVLLGTPGGQILEYTSYLESSPSPAAISGGGLAAHDGEQHGGIFPGRALPESDHIWCQSQPPWT